MQGCELLPLVARDLDPYQGIALLRVDKPAVMRPRVPCEHGAGSECLPRIGRESKERHFRGVIAHECNEVSAVRRPTRAPQAVRRRYLGRFAGLEIENSHLR